MDNVFTQLVAHFGGQESTAEALGVKQATVSGWVRGAHGMSPGIAVRAERATGGAFSRRDLCPNFPWEESAA